MTEQWLSIVEYARTFDVSDMTIRRRIRNGKLQAVLKEGKYYIPVSGEGHTPVPAFAPPMRAEPKVETGSMPRHNTIPSLTPRPSFSPSPHHLSYQPESKAGAARAVPADIRSELDKHPYDLVATQRLLGFCEGVLRRVEQAEALLRSDYEGKIATLEANLRTRDKELHHLAQQVEDLQLLIKIVEKR